MTQENSMKPYALPPLGLNPSTTAAGTSPGSFAQRGKIAPGVEGRWSFASPDTPGMPAPSEKTAWDFLPEGWSTQSGQPAAGPASQAASTTFAESDGNFRTVTYPKGFVPITQLEHARLGIVTPEMQRVAEREAT